MNEFFRVRKFIEYQWRSQSKYYLHSPFVYQFHLNILSGGRTSALDKVELLRKQLKKHRSPLLLTDYGTGNSISRLVSDIERHVAVSHKNGQLLYHLVKYFKPPNILELGTSIGLSSAYLALGNPDATVTSLDGAEEALASAKKNHRELSINNISLIEGNFSETLPSFLKTTQPLGLVFFDGNHQKDNTLDYFHQCLAFSTVDSIFVFDDINWSGEMNDAWKEIREHQKVTLSIETFQFGICFFKKEKLAKENFVLRY